MNQYNKHVFDDNEYISLPVEKWEVGDVIYFRDIEIHQVVHIDKSIWPTIKVAFDDGDVAAYPCHVHYWVLN